MYILLTRTVDLKTVEVANCGVARAHGSDYAAPATTATNAAYSFILSFRRWRILLRSLLMPNTTGVPQSPNYAHGPA